jgi:hypothetical protein
VNGGPGFRAVYLRPALFDILAHDTGARPASRHGCRLLPARIDLASLLLELPEWREDVDLGVEVLTGVEGDLREC